MPEKFVSSLSPTGLQQFGAAPGAPTHSVATSGSFAAVAAAAAAAATFHAPLPPVDQRTYDGRYVWDSPAAAAAAAAAARMHAYHHHPSSHSIAGGGNSSVVGAVGTNPSLAAAELQLAAAAAAAQRRSAAAAAMMSCPPPPTSCVAAAPDPAAAAAAAAAYHHHHHRINPYVDHLYGYPAPSSLRGLSPVDSRSLAAAAGIHPDYMPPGPAQMSGAGLGHRSVMSDLHGSVAPSTIASTDLPFSLESSRLTTPRPGMRQGRKRALSSSPYSDSFDINSMIRFSPNSLVSIMNGSRSGSSTSGSYGHLSAGTISPVMGVHPSSQLHHQLQQHLIRQGTLAATPPFMGHHGSLMHQSAGLTASQQSLILAQQSQVEHMLGKDHINGSGGHSIVHPGMHPHVDQRKNWTVKKEPICSKTSEEKSGNNTESNNQGSDPMKDEPGDFIETNCHWKECLNEFNTQEELVKHINNDHIQANKKSFICRWKDCSRDEKPFKAQYMLVVHMRRHTGEKPHRCTFEGCSKAYSRLENLKTHLRSHTGEKPYMCEFPGCTKAFSNASDRAKHQNRTHSNEKPYVCKAPGCTKRYTDPSSLRKHVKTVHGAEFYANKKHKGIDHCNSNNNQSNGDSNNKEGDNCGNDSSPRSDDGSAVKLSGNLSSPSIKSEDTSSPPQQQHSPSGIETSLVNGYGLLEHGDYADNPISDNNISTTNPVDIIEESEWELAEADELDIPEAAMAAAVIGGSLMSSSVNLLQERNTRNRFKNNLNSKSRMSSLLPPLPPSYPGNNRRTGGSTFIPQTEIKPLQGPVQRKNVDGSFNTAVSKSSVNGVGNRRDSTSTVSSFYGSMRSDNSPHPFGSQMSSRRNSDFSQVSNNRLSSMNSPYDPISPGSSRKSSNVSNFQGISASMTAHLQRLHRRAIENQQDVASTANLVVQTQNMSIDNKPPARLPKIAGQGRQTSMSCQTPQPKDVPNKDSRRASDPVRPLDRNFGVNQSLNRHHSYNNFNRGNMLPPISSKSPATKHDSRNVHHPNANIVLEELDENEPIETNQNLIIPDDMMNYLNQVAENCDDEEHPSSEVSIPISSVSQYAEASSRVPMNMRQQKQTNAYGNNPPTYTTLQPAKQSINNGQYNNQGNQFNNMAPMPVQSNSNQCMAPQNNNSHQQPCTQIMNNVNAMPNNAMYGYQQNNNNGPMNSSGQVNGMCYNHQQRNHQGMHYHAQNQNWNSCSNQMSHNGMMTPSQDSSNNLMPCMPNNINNCNYGHQSPHMCSNQPNQMVNNSGNPQMYCNNHGQNQNTSCMCGNCGSNCMNNIQQQSPTHQLNYTNLMPAKQPSQAASYSQQHNVTANYCFVQQPVQLGDQCMMPNKTPVQGDFMYNPQTQETVLAQTCQKCSGINHCHQAEIQCNDISQSCRPTSKVNGRQPAMRTETYQRTLQYVQQCQQISNDKDQNENVIKKPIRRTSTSTEMSPGCKEVTSTTDNIEKICNSYVAESLDTIPNLGDMRDPVPISPSTMIELPEGRDGDQESCLNTPCMESLKSASHTPLIPNNNMIINDMNSSLANFAEETKYLQLIQ